MSEQKRRVTIPQKLFSFEESNRGYAQLAKELTNGWSIARIAKHNKGFICELEKCEKTRSLAELLSVPLHSRKKQLVSEN